MKPKTNDLGVTTQGDLKGLYFIGREAGKVSPEQWEWLKGITEAFGGTAIKLDEVEDRE